jgi:hypothetical protein
MIKIVPWVRKRGVPTPPRIGEAARRARGRGRWLAALTLGVVCLGLLPAAQAELLVYSATDFVRRCPCPFDTPDHTEVDNGVLKVVDPSSRFFTSVSFPVNLQQVCRFSLLYHDRNANDTLIARLVRKPVVVGGNPFGSPEIMAEVRSASGVPDIVRRATTTKITSPTITKGRAFYYVEVEAPTFNLNVLGVQIDVRPTCP